MASPMALSNLTLTGLERSKSRSLRFSVVGYLYGIDIFASSSLILQPSGSHKKVFVGGRGFPLSQRSFLLFYIYMYILGYLFMSSLYAHSFTYYEIYELYLCLTVNLSRLLQCAVPPTGTDSFSQPYTQLYACKIFINVKKKTPACILGVHMGKNRIDRIARTGRFGKLIYQTNKILILRFTICTPR